MKVTFTNSFARDLKKINDRDLKQKVISMIEEIENAQGLPQHSSIKKLRGDDRYYRIKVGEYRIGIVIEGETITFVRILHRKDIYRHFP